MISGDLQIFQTFEFAAVWEKTNCQAKLEPETMAHITKGGTSKLPRSRLTLRVLLLFSITVTTLVIIFFLSPNHNRLPIMITGNLLQSSRSVS